MGRKPVLLLISTGGLVSANLNNAITCFKGSLDPRPEPPEFREQVGGPAVSQADPYQCGCSTFLGGQSKKVFILGNDRLPSLRRVSPDGDIGSLRETGLYDVGTNAAQGCEEARKRHGKLAVDEKFHEV
jgi:hypothetical protein